MNYKELFIQLTDYIKQEKQLSYADQFRAINLPKITGAKMRSTPEYPVKKKYIVALAVMYPFVIPIVEKAGIKIKASGLDKDEIIKILQARIKALEDENDNLTRNN